MSSDPMVALPALASLGLSGIQRRHVPSRVNQLLLIVGDTTVAPSIRGAAAEAASNLLPTKQRALRRNAITCFATHLRDPAPDVRFWCCFALATVKATSQRHSLRRLFDDAAIVDGWWSVGEEANDAVAAIEGRPVPDRCRAGLT